MVVAASKMVALKLWINVRIEMDPPDTISQCESGMDLFELLVMAAIC